MTTPPIATQQPPSREMLLGFLCAVSAHTLWGLFPIYWRLLSHVDALELVWHRILWSFVLLVALVPLLFWRGHLGTRDAFVAAITSWRVWGISTATAILIAFNWFAFIWAVHQNRVLEASLGYYINPLLNVLLGVMILGERLSRSQWIAVAIATIGVSIMSIANGGIPWVAFAMASSFAFYGLLKKRVPMPVLLGLLLETAVLAVPAAIAIGTRVSTGESALVGSLLSTKFLLIAGGAVTVVPLVLFAAAVTRVDLATIGILQYVGPTLQFLVGAFLFGEPLAAGRLVGFVFVWVGLIVFVIEPLRRSRASKAIRHAPIAGVEVSPAGNR